MTKRSLLAGLGLAPLLAGCNTLSLFNTFTPKDEARRVARDVPFGDDPRQKLDIYAPKGEHRDLPVLVFFYGGGWNSGSKADYVWMGHSLAALGYLVFIPDYRLVPQVFYPVFLEDNTLAVKFVMAHAGAYGGDIRRLGVIGHSAGGYAAAMMALDPRYLGEGAPLKVCVGIAGPYDFYPFDVPASKDAFSQWPRPEETQPVTYARKVDTRFLLMQSRADTVVGVHNAVNLDARLKAAGTDVDLKLYDKLTHPDTAAVFSVPFRNKAPLRADAAAWLKANL
ncbi:MAG: alpha/beta hydrolase [Asticcacaulis sp.]|nr:alpha/beta hydrolase [Asticcacaulis sp.]